MDMNEIVINQRYPGFNPLLFGYEECEPSHGFGPAVRTYWLLHYVRSGKGIFRREGREYSVRAGEMFVIPPLMETYYEADAADPWQYLWIGFECDRSLTALLEVPVIRCAGVGDVFEDMLRCRRFQGGKSAFLTSRLWELFSLLLDAGKVESDPVDEALYYLRSAYMDEIRIAELARRLNLDRCYFTTLFTRRVGLSPSQYLLRVRMEKAAELMTVHGKSPSIAAGSVGYPDIYTFSKMFKKHFGCSPRQYISRHA